MRKEFQTFLWDNGITWESRTPGNPQQNGAAELLNNTLITKLYQTMISASVSNKCQPRILQTVNCLRKRITESSINKTPYEGYKNTIPNLRHLRISNSWA
jgi:transposase InsO family protein